MDDFERGAREMQRVAAEAMDKLAKQTEQLIAACSAGLDHGYTRNRLVERMGHYIEAGLVIRSIKIQDTVDG